MIVDLTKAEMDALILACVDIEAIFGDEYHPTQRPAVHAPVEVADVWADMQSAKATLQKASLAIGKATKGGALI